MSNDDPGIELIKLPCSTPELNAALYDLIETFSVIGRPSGSGLRLGIRTAPDDNVNADSLSVFVVINDIRNAKINASNIMSLRTLVYYCTPNAVLWLLPKIFNVLNEWWCAIIKEEGVKTTNTIKQPIAIEEWRERSF